MFRPVPFRTARCRRLTSVCAGALILLCLALVCHAQNPISQLVTGKSKPADTPAATAPAASSAADAQSAAPQIIPLPEVAVQSETLSQTLGSITATLPTNEQLAAINSGIAEHGTTLNTKREEVEALLSGSPSSSELREQENYWRGFQNLSSGWRKQLLGWANVAQGAVDQLDKLEPQWVATLDAYKNETELAPVVRLIRENLANVRKLRSRAMDELQLIVKMQIATGAQDQAAADVISRLSIAQQAFNEGLLTRDSLPFWQPSARRQQGENKDLYSTASSRWTAIREFAREHKGIVAFLLVLAAISLAMASRLRNATRTLETTLQIKPDARLLLERWIALGVLAPLLLAYVLAPAAPLPLNGLVVLASFFPILRLLAPLLGPQNRLMLYCLAGYYALATAVSWISVNFVLKREIGFLVVLLLFGTFAYLLRPKRSHSFATLSGGKRLLLLGARFAVATLGVSLVANFCGYVRLAQYLSLACVFSVFIGVSMYTGTRVYTTLLTAALELPQAERLAAARLHRERLLRWTPRIFVTIAVLVWLSSTLDLLRLHDGVASAIEGVLSFRIAGSASEITLGSVLGFFLMLAVGYLVASAIRFLLREEVLSRFHLARGLPDLIASTVYYLLLLFVFLVAVNAGGVELNKFTLLTGALGVGFGFGMQNVINNFVSGLILQFERPIHINDVLEVDGYTGKVTRIGVRSSTLQTFQGAEVIIPNANFISGKVINWTLSESKRRAELPIGVAYGTDPNIVLQFLLDAANKHESVLTDPPPAAYFKGFGESSLDFELQFWVMQDSNWVRVRSDIAMVVMKSLDAVGIEIPFPQRDLHLRSVDTAASVHQQSGSGSAVLDETGSAKSMPTRRKTVSTDGD
ncbi:MAG TPA: mechanosensitive ion channel domain-containing protein [Candidatus Acidoferrales bacterium]|nr:mechanosensitive ion channel domain-containing protein [Candidatus Acidoferrales bacterium]